MPITNQDELDQAAAYAFWIAFFHSDQTIVMLSRTKNFAKKLLQMSKARQLISQHAEAIQQ